MSSVRGNLTVNTIPVPKLTTMLNDFIVKTVNDLNKLSVYVENKMERFDNKIREMEIMVTLLEAKLNSLPPEITSKYPDLTYKSLNDVNPVINPVINLNQEVKKEEVKPLELIKEVEEPENNEENKIEQNGNNPENIQVPQPLEETPEQKLKNFLEKEESEELMGLYKMLKFRIHEDAVLQKARMINYDMNLAQSLLELYKAANPNP